jgi:hypothetical protein
VAFASGGRRAVGALIAYLVQGVLAGLGVYAVIAGVIADEQRGRRLNNREGRAGLGAVR